MRRPNSSERGGTAISVLVVLVPVLFGMIGFAVDLGMMYSVRSDLKAAAGSMALAAASQLMGTEASTSAATLASQQIIETSTGFGNKYYFSGYAIGQQTGTLTSTVNDPGFYASLADALGSASQSGSEVGGSLAKHVRITLTGQTRLLFWGFLPIINGQNINVAATAVAGISAPLCQACGIEPFAIAALDSSEPVDFGYVLGTKYSLTYLCNGAPNPGVLPGAVQRVPYVLLNRQDLNTTVFADDTTQTYRAGAAGLPGNTSSGQACFRISNPELIWPTALANACNANRVASPVTGGLCGLSTRFDANTPDACTSIPDIGTLSTAYQPDTDISDYDTYADYTGNGRRIVTLPIVDQVSGTVEMNVLGFRQFLLIPAQGGSNIVASDAFGRFAAMYIGSVAPVKQGRFDGCQITNGPGKVVLHQ